MWRFDLMTRLLEGAIGATICIVTFGVYTILVILDPLPDKASGTWAY